MGRRPKPRPAHPQLKAVPASPPVCGSSPVHGGGLPSEDATFLPEKSLVPTEIPSPLAEKVESLPPNAVQDILESQLKRKAKSIESSDASKLQKQCNGEVRRSVRLRNAVMALTNPDTDSQPLTPGYDKNEDMLQLCNEKQVPSSSYMEKDFEAKVDCLEKQVETLLGLMNAMHSKVQDLSLSGCAHHDDANNRTSHLDCEKKIAELMIANRDLTLKLEDAQTNVKLHERRLLLFSEVLDKLKNTILLFELSKAAEQLP
ncbi:hypothetical protein MLD38_025078 [Melastoma candidum]|uniref:Uncharacterized protein n=1 Tax=Melastoma candidum TaxID=119954 RepID=A0ACB9NVL7_9MYRT|nr:hypothetical protein MLD38_025078 [Melastoma candidum]